MFDDRLWHISDLNASSGDVGYWAEGGEDLVVTQLRTWFKCHGVGEILLRCSGSRVSPLIWVSSSTTNYDTPARKRP